MSKKNIILIILSAVLLVLVLVLIATAESGKKIVSPGRPVETVKNENVVLSAASYQAKVKEIFLAYEKSVADDNFTLEKIAELKNKLLGVKGLPAQFKNLHLDFILALDRMEKYLADNDDREKTISQKMMAQLKTDYSWLNN